jgi:AcrR family transcriptional regulator
MTGDDEAGVPADGLWLRPERSGRGPAPEYSRSQIAAAAVRLADEGGLAAVSMRRVAGAIGAAPASLYRYLANREELVLLMADRAIGELDFAVERSGDWLADLLAVARQQLALFRRHPWLLDLTGIGPFTMSPSVVDFLEHTITVLAGLDVPSRTKLEAVAMMSGVVSLFARDELARERGHTSAEGQLATAAFLSRVAAEGRHPHLVTALASAAATPDPVDQDVLFDRVLSGILTGLLHQA